jgi:hypothetical protein
LKWDNDVPICNKCGAELIAIPDENCDREFETGKICPVSASKKAEGRKST